MDETITLQQNIPTPAWGMRLVAANVDGTHGRAIVIVEPPGALAVPHEVHVGDTVPFGDRRLRVDTITGGAHDGPPGRGTGRVGLTLLEGGTA